MNRMWSRLKVLATQNLPVLGCSSTLPPLTPPRSCSSAGRGGEADEDAVAVAARQTKAATPQCCMRRSCCRRNSRRITGGVKIRNHPGYCFSRAHRDDAHLHDARWRLSFGKGHLQASVGNLARLVSEESSAGGGKREPHATCSRCIVEPGAHVLIVKIPGCKSYF